MNKPQEIMATHQGAIDALLADCKANGVNIILLMEMDAGATVVGGVQVAADVRTTSHMFDAALFFAQRSEVALAIADIVPVMATRMTRFAASTQTDEAAPVFMRNVGLQ